MLAVTLPNLPACHRHSQALSEPEAGIQITFRWERKTCKGAANTPTPVRVQRRSAHSQIAAENRPSSRRSSMMRKIFLVLGAVVAMFASVGSASAASVTPQAAGSTPAVESAIVKVHGWHNRCRRGPVWRWGGRGRCHRHRGWKVRRCSPRRCWRRPPRCRYWRRECRDRFGYGWRYRRCKRRHGC